MSADRLQNPEENCTAVGADKAASDSVLQGWLDVCPFPLSAAVKAGVLALVKAVEDAK
tara:strand:- start:341 stop:514 length:174 start_codon:yes stop_codon:yes gene_type:complete